MSKDKSDKEKIKTDQKKKKMEKKRKSKKKIKKNDMKGKKVKKEKKAKKDKILKNEKDNRDRDRKEKMSSSQERDIDRLPVEQTLDRSVIPEPPAGSDDGMATLVETAGDAQDPFSPDNNGEGPAESRPPDENPEGTGSGEPGRITFFRTFDDEIVRIDHSQIEAEPAPSWVGPRQSTDPIPVIPGYYTLADAFENFRRRQEDLEVTGDPAAMTWRDRDLPDREGSGKIKRAGRKTWKNLKKTAKKNDDPAFSLNELMEGLAKVPNGSVPAQKELDWMHQEFDATIDDAIRSVLRQIWEAEASGGQADFLRERILI